MLASKQRIGDQISHFFSFIQVDIWRIRLADLPFGKSFLIKQLRMIILAFRGYDEDRCLLRASSLTFYTLLSIVPVAAMFFGVAKGFGFERRLEKELFQILCLSRPRVVSLRELACWFFFGPF
jgi:membrane protein